MTQFEIDLATAPPLSPDRLLQYNHRYHGAFNQTLGKLLHVQQWIRPDLNFAISRLPTFVKSPTHNAFEALNTTMQYLFTHPHEPIFYPRSPIGPPQTITYHLSSHQSMSYSLPSGITAFSDSAFGNILPERHSMQDNEYTLNGVIISWDSNIQSTIAADSTDAEVKAFYICAKKTIAFHNFLVSSSFHSLLSTPIPIFVDNQATISIIKQKKISYRSRHLDIPVAFSYENLNKQYYDLVYIDSKLNAADTSTKATSGPIHQRHWNFLCGTRFFSPPDTPHRQYLLDFTQATQTLTSAKK